MFCNVAFSSLIFQDYYPGGMPQPGRGYVQNASKPYRFGFNGKENDNEVKGKGNQQDYGMRIYDTRLQRFLSTDPLYKSYPELTPYQYASNSPIENIDLDGLEKYSIHYTVRNGKDVILKITTDNSLKYLASPSIKGIPTWKPKVAEYIKEDANGRVISKTGELDLKNLGSTMYVGPWNPQYSTKKDRFDLPPLNSLDAAGFKHDKAYDAAYAKGTSSAIKDLNVIDADKALVKESLDVVGLYLTGKKDPITNQKVSYETAETALNVAAAFTVIVAEKSSRLGIKDASKSFSSELKKAKQGLKDASNWTPTPAH
jgi:RHS repeat-associated protein